MLRKQLIKEASATQSQEGEIPVAAVATVLVTSETADHPIDNVFDRQKGPGGSRWVAHQPGEQTVHEPVGRHQQVVETGLDPPLVVAPAPLGVDVRRPRDRERVHPVLVLELVRGEEAVLAARAG